MTGPEFVNQDGAAGDALREIVALDEFHHEGVYSRGLLEPVDLGDVRVIQGRERLGLALESRQAIGVCREGIRQHLDRHLAAQARIGGTVHRTHAALTEQLHRTAESK